MKKMTTFKEGALALALAETGATKMPGTLFFLVILEEGKDDI